MPSSHCKGFDSLAIPCSLSKCPSYSTWALTPYARPNPRDALTSLS